MTNQHPCFVIFVSVCLQAALMVWAKPGEWSSIGGSPTHTNSIKSEVTFKGQDWVVSVFGNTPPERLGPIAISTTGNLFVATAEPESKFINVTAITPSSFRLWTQGYQIRDGYTVDATPFTNMVIKVFANLEMLYFATDINRGLFYGCLFIAIDANNGSVVWRKEFPFLNPPSNIAYSYKTNALILYGGRCETCTPTPVLLASISITDGSLLWSKQISQIYESADSTLIVGEDNGDIYLSSGIGQVDKFDSAGTFVWEVPGLLPTVNFALSPNESFLVINNQSDFIAVDAKSGRQIWTFPKPGCDYSGVFPSFDATGNIYISCSNYALSVDKYGKQRWKSNQVGAQGTFAFEVMVQDSPQQFVYFVPSIGTPGDNPPKQISIYAIELASGNVNATPKNIILGDVTTSLLDQSLAAIAGGNNGIIYFVEANSRGYSIHGMPQVGGW